MKKKVLMMILIMLMLVGCGRQEVEIEEKVDIASLEQEHNKVKPSIESEQALAESENYQDVEAPEITDIAKDSWSGQIGEEGIYFSSNYPQGTEVLISQFTGDITHDGLEDLIQVTGYSLGDTLNIEEVTSISSAGCYVKVFEGTIGGEYEKTPIFISRNFHMAHMGNGTICLSKVNGEVYLLVAETSEGQGSALYRFEAIYVDKEDGIVIKDSEETKFYVDRESHTDWEELTHREDVMDEFRARIEPFLEESVLLLSMDTNEGDAQYSTDDKKLDATAYFDKVWLRTN